MPNIDIKLKKSVEDALKIPPCVDLSFPKPKPLKITLPTGGSLNAFTDMSKGMPTDCAMTASLLHQITPLLASMACLLKILGLLAPLIKVVKGLPFPPADAIKDFLKAAEDLTPCLNVVIAPPANLGPFIKDILCLILKVLRCYIGQLNTIIRVVGGLSLQIQTAEAAGNTDLLASLKCSQENANKSAQGALQAMEPIGALLALVAPVMTLAGQDPISLPALGTATDVDSLQTVVTTLTGVADAIEIVTDALGGCA